MIQVYNTQAREKQDFFAQNKGEIHMYVCGPTVYNYIHVGNARTFVSFDIIRRYFEWRGFTVKFVQNITDVDDKIIAKANEEGRSAEEVAAEYTQAFIDDMEALGVEEPTVRPKATEEIPEMIELIQLLIDSDHAYESEGDVYFRVRSFDQYGQLSGRNVDEMESGHRELRSDAAEGRKEDELDFAIWKAAKEGEPAWDSPWGAGRPGWHIECSAMAKKYLDLPLDIHGGGADLVFPHHENETAQAEAAWGVQFAKYWMHGGMLRINNEKMSKSLGNFLLLHDLLKTTDPRHIRMLMLQTHYRSPLDFSDDRLKEAASALERIENFLDRLHWAMDNAEVKASPFDGNQLGKDIRQARNEFIYAMDDDFNTAAAVAVIFSLMNSINADMGDAGVSVNDVPILKMAHALIIELMGVFGIELHLANQASAYPPEVIMLAEDLAGYAGNSEEDAVDALLKAREDARAEKDFEKADQVRDGLVRLGFTIEDTPQGARVLYGNGVGSLGDMRN